CQQYNDFLLTF
nr:immunoglobulin light chain junction region [Macaca mulatta]MOV80272.1 immunoglobulin light chain junction region [Macaca mulatta]MOV85860.1 immunoglobulin light chain junction region [Macaca mulatta]MOW07898.1 immunoglobulin light chain junction region [Macaca mulatta]